MRFQLKSAMLACAFSAGIMISSAPAHAQFQAALPMVETVTPGEATDADGTYVVSTIDKRITIENGRAYVIDPWTQALLFRIKPGMVTLKNFRQTGPNTFEADDLPMMGKVVFYRQPNGALQGVVKGALGEAKYILVPTEYASVENPGPPDGIEPPAPPPPPPAIEKPRIYNLYVSGGECKGSSLLRKRYRGVVRISVTDREGELLTSKNRNFSVRCTKKGPRKQDYNFYSNGPGALTITIPPGQAGFSDLQMFIDLSDPLGVLNFKKEHDLLAQARALGRDLTVNETISEWNKMLSGKANMSFKVTMKRVQ